MIGNEVAVPDVVEPIRAIRVWFPGPFALQSGQENIVWPVDGPLHARCIKPRDRYYYMSFYYPSRPTRPAPPHEAPAKDCRCGIYSFRTVEDAMVEFDPAEASGAVWGEVLLSGRVFEHEHGYRAEFAEVASIFRPPTGGLKPVEGDLAERAAAVYGVPLLDFPLDGPGMVAALARRDDRRRQQYQQAFTTSTLTMPTGSSSFSITFDPTSAASIESPAPPQRNVTWKHWAAVVIWSVLSVLNSVTLTTNLIERAWGQAAFSAVGLACAFSLAFAAIKKVTPNG